MTLKEFKEFISTVKYKPGFKISIEDDQQSPLFLRLELLVRDAYNEQSTELLPLTKMIAVGEYDLGLDKPFWRQILFRYIQQLEMHEAGEFFQIEGERPFDPHRKSA